MGQGDPESHPVSVRKMVALAWMFGASSLPEGHGPYANTLLCVALRWALQDEAQGKQWTWPDLRSQLYTNVQPLPEAETRAALDAFDAFDGYFATMRQQAVAQGVDLRAFADGLRDCEAIMLSLPSAGGASEGTPPAAPRREPPRKKPWEFWK